MASRSLWKLWTIQSRKTVRRLASTGVIHGPEARHVQQSWRPAYRLMRDHMRRCGLLDSLRFPIWAWHSCGKWQQAPGAERVRWYLSDDQIDLGYMMIALRAPRQMTVLSDYGEWCDLIADFADNDRDASSRMSRLPNGLFDISVEKTRDGWNHNSRHDIQACLPFLKASWVLAVAPVRPTGEVGEWRGC